MGLTTQKDRIGQKTKVAICDLLGWTERDWAERMDVVTTIERLVATYIETIRHEFSLVEHPPNQTYEEWMEYYFNAYRVRSTFLAEINRVHPKDENTAKTPSRMEAACVVLERRALKGLKDSPRSNIRHSSIASQFSMLIWDRDAQSISATK
ncbi:MAG: hypothetical protein M1834_009392 [Cirrosporium novae-zelandiae]|nr:MAG: hypothetical protein M1834_009392 [Cirrosporium novae-zelandiae]